MLAQPVTLITVLSDGSEHRRTGLVLQAAAEDSDGGFARYRLTVQPWVGFLAQTLRSRVWQEQNVTAIVDSVLGDYAAYGKWRWSPCSQQFLADATEGGVRSYCVQYRESDLDFLSRLLAEEGVGYRFEEADAGATGPTLVLFADTASARYAAKMRPPGRFCFLFYQPFHQKKCDWEAISIDRSAATGREARRPWNRV